MPAEARPTDAPLGGQAVREGVMMRGPSTWAVAVREPGGGIAVRRVPFASVARRHRVLRRPIIRGVVALAESLRIGAQALAISAGGRPASIAPALCLGVGLFFVLPAVLARLVTEQGSWLVEGGLRIGLFLGAVALLSRVRGLRRAFEYHGAEHKAVACFEAGLPLTPASAQRCSRLHPRCGTSFLLTMMVVASVVVAPLGRPDWELLVASRILVVPLVAGLSFELMRWPRRPTWPGLQLQKLTTREPDAAQLAVAIAALAAVARSADAPIAEPGRGTVSRLDWAAR